VFVVPTVTTGVFVTGMKCEGLSTSMEAKTALSSNSDETDYLRNPKGVTSSLSLISEKKKEKNHVERVQQWWEGLLIVGAHH
jgi:hypothetical protein